jgi:hypothetical protein
MGNPMTQAADLYDRMSEEARELVIFIENDADLYRQQTVLIQQNLLRKMRKGVYDPQKAVKLWMYLMEAGAKKYAKAFDAPGVPWHRTFSMAVRLEAATMMARSW